MQLFSWSLQARKAFLIGRRFADSKIIIENGGYDMKMEDYNSDPIDPDDSDNDPGGMKYDNWGSVIMVILIVPVIGFILLSFILWCLF